MNATKAIVDPQGFLEAADAFKRASTVNISALAYHVEGSMSRVATLVRALARILESNDPWIYKNDIHDLVEMASEAVGDPEDVFDQMDRFEIDMKHAFVQHIEERQHLTKIIDALELCWREASLNELEKAANDVHNAAGSNPAYGPYWERFHAKLEECGLVVTEKPIVHNGKVYICVDEPAPDAERAATATGRAPA